MTRTCPVCRKSFGTKAQLRSHALSAHSSVAGRMYASQPQPAANSAGRARRRRPAVRLPQPGPSRGRRAPGGNGQRGNVQTGISQISRVVTGSEFLDVASVAHDSAAGTVIYDSEIGPEAFRATRWHQESLLYSRWRPLRLVFRVVSTAGTFVNGSYQLAWSGEVAAQRMQGTPVDRIKRAAVMRPSIAAQVSASSQITIPCTGALAPAQRWLHCRSTDPDERAHGRVVLLLSGDISNLAAGNVNLSLFLDWTVELANPTLAEPVQEVARGPFSAVTLGDGFGEPVFTTELADQNRLLLKSTAGGDPCKFAGVTDNAMYRLDPRANIQIANGDGSFSRVGYGVSRGGVMYVFHDTEIGFERAKEVAGGEDEFTPYHAAGAWSTGPIVFYEIYVPPPPAPGDELRLLRRRLAQLAVGCPGNPAQDPREDGWEELALNQ